MDLVLLAASPCVGFAQDVLLCMPQNLIQMENMVLVRC